MSRIAQNKSHEPNESNRTRVQMSQMNRTSSRICCKQKGKSQRSRSSVDHQVKVKGAVLHLKARTKHRGSTANKQLQRDYCSSSTCRFMLAAAVLFCLLRNCACNGMLRQEQSTEAAAQQQQTRRDCSSSTCMFMLAAAVLFLLAAELCTPTACCGKNKAQRQQHSNNKRGGTAAAALACSC